jgi:hypothetical protein
VRGVRQQHALSAAAFFYLTVADEIRSLIDLAYAEWLHTTAVVGVDQAGNIAQFAGAPVWTGDMPEGVWPPGSFRLDFDRPPGRRDQLHEAVRDALTDALQRDAADRAKRTKRAKRRKR